MDSEQRLADSLGVSLTLHTIQINNHTIRYAKAGEGDPVLLIHGGTLGWGWWHPNIAELAKHFTVYAIDLPGGGRSSHVDFRHVDFERDFVDTTEEFISQLNIRPVSLIGASVGGWVATKIALRKKIPIKKLVLVDFLGLTGYRRMRELVLGIHPIAQLFVRTIFRPSRDNPQMESMLRDVFVNKAHALKAEFVDYFYDTMARSHNLLFISKTSSVEGRKALLLQRDDLQSITQPTLIMWGEQDSLMPLAKYAPFFSHFPRAQVLIVKDAGHIPSIEKSEEFNEAIIRFLSK